MKKEIIVKSLPTAVAVLLIAAYRLLPHPWNFAPVCATAIFSGIYLNKRLAFLLPVVAMFVADLFLGLDWIITPVIYGCILLSTGIGLWIKDSYSRKLQFIGKTVAGTFLSAVLFFIITNFASWLTLDMYTKDWSGLISCYTLAIPFFGNSLAGDMFFVSVFIGIYELVQFGVQVSLKPQAVRSLVK